MRVLIYVVGSSGGPPRIVALVPLSRSVDTAEVLRRLIAEEISDSAFDAESRVVYGSLKKHRTKFAFVQSFSNRVMDVIDVARVADVVMFVANAPAQLGNSSTNKIDDGSQVAQNFSDMIDEVGPVCNFSFLCLAKVVVLIGRRNFPHSPEISRLPITDACCQWTFCDWAFCHSNQCPASEGALSLY